MYAIMTTLIDCPACGKIEPTVWLKPRRSNKRTACYGARRIGIPNPHGPLFTCPSCGWGLQHPLPATAELHALYRELTEQTYLEDAATRMAQFKRELEELRVLHDKDDATLLDFGCSYGLMLEAAEERGFKTVGLELGKEQVQHCLARGFDVRSGGIECLAPEEKFDLVIAWDVLEHVIDPLETLRSLRKHVVQGGVISLVVPDRGSHIARLLGERWWSILELHLHYPTKQGMVNILERSGFTIIEIKTHPKLMSARLLVEWLPFTFARTALSRIIPESLELTIDPRDQMRIHARVV